MRHLTVCRMAFVSSSMVGLLIPPFLGSSASATHVRPQGATPKLDSLVISYRPCTSPNTGRAASPPPGGMNVQSCTNPVTSSPFLTVGSPPANGLPANFSGSVRLDVCPVPGCAAPDVRFQVSATDVRCTGMLAAVNAPVCPSGNLGPYTGSIGTRLSMQITGHCNESPPIPPCPATPGTAATTVSFTFPITTPCSPGLAGQGSTCAITGTLNGVVPGFVVGGYQENVETTVTIQDGGPDGNGATSSNQLFLTEGYFVP